jgi:predicted nucleic-acid-binding protein
MLGLDTNVLVRLLTGDDPAQSDRARRLIERRAAAGEPVFVSLLVLLEAAWVLRSRYGFDKAQVSRAIEALLESAEITIEDESVVEEALHRWENSVADFADCLIAACYSDRGCRATVTFDAKAVLLAGFVAA